MRWVFYLFRKWCSLVILLTIDSDNIHIVYYILEKELFGDCRKNIHKGPNNIIYVYEFLTILMLEIILTIINLLSFNKKT